MTIVVISDTHIPGKAKSLPQILYNEIEKCDHIIHAGDVNDIALINELEILIQLLWLQEIPTDIK